ncbi:MAG: NAD(P)H-hydrate dehydratase [Gemmatimonadota bacterium]
MMADTGAGWDLVSGGAGVAVPTGSEAASFDRWSIDTQDVPERVLMENAGRSAAQIVARLFPEGGVVVLAGSGNNGGDGHVVARTLRAWGREVRLVPLGPTAAHRALSHGWDLPLLDPDDVGTDAALAGAAVLVDGLLGTGLSGPPRQPHARLIARLHAAGPPVLALDIPSGVDGATGAVPGAAVQARVTVAFGAPKRGTLLHPGRAHAGRLLAVEIGFPPAGDRLGAGVVLTPGWACAHRPVRPAVTHKKAVGSLLVVAGQAGMAGAALLCARAALRAGVGLVRVATPAANREVVQRGVPEALWLDRDDPDALEAARAQSDAVVAGPGMGTDDAARRALTAALAGPDPAPAVLDADALTLLAGEAEGRPVGHPGLLLTPHPGELARLAGRPGSVPDPERAEVAAEVAARWGATVLAKGTPSLVCAPDGAWAVDVQGSSDLAAAGMGDVLAGVAGAGLAQGLDPFRAAGLALHDCGRAHRRVGLGVSLVPSDLIESLPHVLRLPPPSSPLGLPFVTLDLPAPW